MTIDSFPDKAPGASFYFFLNSRRAVPTLSPEYSRQKGSASRGSKKKTMTDAQEAVSKAIRRNLGTVRTFTCPNPASPILLYSTPALHSTPLHSLQFSVPQFLAGGDGPPSKSDMSLCRNVAFWRESVASERKHAARARSHRAASAPQQVHHHAPPAVLHAWPLQLLPVVPPPSAPPSVWVASVSQPQQFPFTQPLLPPPAYYPIVWLPPPA